MDKKWWTLQGEKSQEVEIELSLSQAGMFNAMLADEDTIKRVWFAHLMDGAAMRGVTWGEFYHMYIHAAAVIAQAVSK